VNRGGSNGSNNSEIRVTTTGRHHSITTNGINNLYVNVVGENDIVEYDKISIKEITSEYIQIEGNYTRESNSEFGVQTLAFETNDANVPIGKCTHICGKDDGRYIMIPVIDPNKQKFLVTECLSEISGTTDTDITTKPCGTQIIEDPNFDDPSKWSVTPGNTWTVSGSKATCNTIGAVYCNGYSKKDKTYDIKITIDPGAVFTGVGLTVRASYDQEAHFTSSGTHTVTMTASGSNTYIILDSLDQAGTPAFVGSVSFLSVIERP